MPTAFSRLHIAPYIDEFLARYPEIELDVHITDAFVDIIREGFDLAIRIGELEDSSLVARKHRAGHARDLRRARRISRSTARRRASPTSKCTTAFAADTVDVWKLEGPEGEIKSARTATCAPIRASSSASS